jgi:hypothetical protein
LRGETRAKKSPLKWRLYYSWGGFLHMNTEPLHVLKNVKAKINANEKRENVFMVIIYLPLKTLSSNLFAKITHRRSYFR